MLVYAFKGNLKDEWGNTKYLLLLSCVNQLGWDVRLSGLSLYFMGTIFHSLRESKMCGFWYDLDFLGKSTLTAVYSYFYHYKILGSSHYSLFLSFLNVDACFYLLMLGQVLESISRKTPLIMKATGWYDEKMNMWRYNFDFWIERDVGFVLFGVLMVWTWIGLVILDFGLNYFRFCMWNRYLVIWLVIGFEVK